ncbi:MAG: hypothetical protein ACK6DB_07930 [Planctomycetota bacterium]
MIAIQLDQKPPHYAPGEEITGDLSWSELPVDCTSLELRLFWYTNGKGDRDLEVVASCRLERPGPIGRQRFAFSSPGAPYSFSGKLISLSWGLEAVPLPGGDSLLVELVLGPSGEEVQISRQQGADS